MDNRIIGEFGGALPGALVLVFGAMHGNEPAGVLALQSLFKRLESVGGADHDFIFKGKVIGLIGNRQAYAAAQRYIAYDLNRRWTSANLANILQADPVSRSAEDREIAELMAFFHQEITAYQPETVILLDLHTTSAQGGIFCIPADDAPSLRLAKELHAPVLLGMLQGLEGTLLHLTSSGQFVFNGFPRHAIGVAFEAGQHDDPRSVDRALDAVLHCLRACGCLPPDALQEQPDTLVDTNQAASLPRVTRIRYVHHIRPGAHFTMRAGYVNFQPIQRGEYLADEDARPVLAPLDGLILMPLYQPKGSDGFFVVEEI